MNPGRRREDRGAATIWIISAAAVVLVIALVATARTQAVLARHRAGVAADLSALAAAAGIGLDPDQSSMCGRAAPIALANGAVLTSCSVRLDPSGRTGTVEVAVRVSVTLLALGARLVTAKARAGRLPPGLA